MCGIAGLIDFRVSDDVAVGIVQSMCDALAHRGPDGGGVTSRNGVTLGMKRLAIVDVEHGHQPMLSDDKQVALVYNGEIYNAPEIRGRLEKQGVRFHTRSDTEVILRLYEQNPQEVEEHLVGMWAFAIHDRRRNRVLLSRDRFGIKPLFLVRAPHALAFASEIAALYPLRAREGFAGKFALDAGSAHAMLSWGYVPECESIYTGVKRLEPGSRVEINLATLEQQTKTYWFLRPSVEAAQCKSLSSACELVEFALRRAVREHLESDVPVASFLSGGIDSSLLTAFAVDASAKPIESFCIGFREKSFDESPYARVTAQQLGIQFHVEYLGIDNLRVALADALLAYDEPFGDSSSLATYLLSKNVAKTHKVVLGGDGGDEVFAGYAKHRIVPFRHALKSFPVVRNGLAKLLYTLPNRTDRTRWWTDILRTVRRAARGLSGSDSQAYVSLTEFGTLAQTAPLVQNPVDPVRFEAPAEARYQNSSGTLLQRTLICDLANPLPNDMLTKVDRASMVCHLEARVPFLDHRVVEIGVGLPQEYSLGRTGKVVLRALHERRFGKALARRTKHGFGVPVERWLRGPLHHACDQLFETRRMERYGLLNPQALGRGAWRRWAQTDPQLLWNAFALASWCEAREGDGPGVLRDFFSEV